MGFISFSDCFRFILWPFLIHPSVSPTPLPHLSFILSIDQMNTQDKKKINQKQKEEKEENYKVRNNVLTRFSFICTFLTTFSSTNKKKMYKYWWWWWCWEELFETLPKLHWCKRENEQFGLLRAYHTIVIRKLISH